MNFIYKECEKCSRIFKGKRSEVNRGNARFCSRKCSAKRPNPNRRNRVKVTCSYCNVIFERTKSKLVGSSSGLYFCSREHKDKAQRIGGISEIQPPHYGTTLTDYKQLALRNYEPICIGCGYDKLPEILEVHHKNHNRKDNTLENLEFLCPNCHQEHHYLTKSGRYTIS